MGITDLRPVIGGLCLDSARDVVQLLADRSDEIVEAEGSVEDMISIAQTAEFLILSRNYRRQHELRDSLSDQIIDAVQCPALGVHTHESDRPGIVGRVIERLVF